MISAPGRVNLIGEHIDYHGLPVLPMALRRAIRVRFTPRTDHRIHAVSAPLKNTLETEPRPSGSASDGCHHSASVGRMPMGAPFGERAFEWTSSLAPVARGDWENYLRAAAQAVAGKWGVLHGIDAVLESDLPPAAGLSSSSALIVAFTLALLRANQRHATFEELMSILPDGEQFVGTRGGGMDHAASLASRAGHATLIEFTPLAVHHIPIPPDWAFLVAHSRHTAEKSGAVRERYNAVRAAGTVALVVTGFSSYTSALQRHTPGDLIQLAGPLLPPPMRDSFLHVVTEADRVRQAVECMRADRPARFGEILLEGHASLRDRLGVSCPALDTLVEAAMASGAIGARLTGAGFGGCAVVFCMRRDLAKVREGLIERFYSGVPDYIIDAEPGPGAVNS